MKKPTNFYTDLMRRRLKPVAIRVEEHKSIVCKIQGDSFVAIYHRLREIGRLLKKSTFTSELTLLNTLIRVYESGTKNKRTIFAKI
ncbi:hypothetical protein [Leptospira borgpetersenii]|uniref:hypothetical protein n=2 Tax=Leptospira borgpetersenii TaxID=174 RepID=UPI0007742E5D|nr:hypothetical protein [Leptospira borgpetersenii]MBE8363272.1 hypothetical protein [Leptospira borgpetersenii serovar Balcanica]MBE8366367.1 hypothetical protein [Leptospira borgpetersenii serovar Balcanica]MBE8403393.1 hypothetical protein [Leptospira borgpetersenii serovar Tarassovi]MBE8422816.1 hypothetical protein [Leptospira borgpetersenii serovar Balcanica]MBE8426726.1 hypothetical protein [Leptospira borgpetersenii serovar Tarassovi]